jgi:hypothetical protein
MERYLGFWGYVKIGEKLGFRTFWPKPRILFFIWLPPFWGFWPNPGNPEIGTFSPNLEFLKRDLLPLFWECAKIGTKPQFSGYFSSKFDFTGGFLGSFSEKLKKGRPNQHQEKCPNPAQICSRFTCHFLDFFGGLARGLKKCPKRWRPISRPKMRQLGVGLNSMYKNAPHQP